jgi:hypothetical protein
MAGGSLNPEEWILFGVSVFAALRIMWSDFHISSLEQQVENLECTVAIMVEELEYERKK